MPPVGFEPTISADERPHTHALDCAATGTGNFKLIPYSINKLLYVIIYYDLPVSKVLFLCILVTILTTCIFLTKFVC